MSADRNWEQARIEVENEVIVLLAGNMGGKAAGYGTCRHEAAHAVIGRALGMRVGAISVIPVENSRVMGYCEVSRTPFTSPASPPKADLPRDHDRAAKWCTMIGQGGWRSTLSEVRRLKRRAQDLVLAHGDVISEFAIELSDRRYIPRDEAAKLLDELEDRLNAEAIAGLLSGEFNGLHGATLARIYTAAERLAGDVTLSGAQRKLWQRVESAAWARINSVLGAEIGWLIQCGRDQEAAVQRIVTAVQRIAVCATAALAERVAA